MSSHGGLIIRPPAGSVNSLVLNDGQNYVSANGFATSFSVDADKGFVNLQDDVAVQNPGEQKSGLYSWLGTLLVLAATASSMYDTYYLIITMDCLLLEETTKKLALVLSILSVSLGLFGSVAKIFVTNPEEGDSKSESCRRRYNICLRNLGQISEDLSIIFALLPTLYGLLLRQSTWITKLTAVLSFVATVVSFREEPHGAYPCRKFFSSFLLLAAGGIFVVSFLSVERDKSLVIYRFTDDKTAQSFKFALQEDQIAFDTTRNCLDFKNNVCSPCTTAAVYGRGNNTWAPLKNDTGQCAGVTLTVVEADDCTQQGDRVPFTVTVFPEDSCAVLNVTCTISTYFPALVPE